MKKLLLGALAFATAAFFNPASAGTTITANGGAVTQYIFRGVPQSDKAAAQGGVDLDVNGFYAGTWFSTVDDGLEYDLYAGYAFEVDDFSFGIGGTGYFYTDDFDETYVEVNLSAGWKFITIDYARGEYDSQPSKTDYDFLSVTLEYEGFYGRYGTWGDDLFKGVESDFIEIGYGNTLTVADKDLFDYTFAIIRTDKDISFNFDSNGNPDEETFFYAGVVKNFDLFSN